MAAALQISDLTVHYETRGSPRTVLRGLALTIQPGEAVGIYGDSGSGKTTLARAIPRLLPATATAVGRVAYGGADLLRHSTEQMRSVRGRQISYIPQEPSVALNPVMPIGSQVAEVLRAHRSLDQVALREVTLALLTQVFPRHAERVASSYPHQLSGGERQRVVICQAIAAGPSLLIADEPTSALDSIAQREFLDLLHQLRRNTGLSLLLLSHHIRALRYATDRLLELRDGRLYE